MAIPKTLKKLDKDKAIDIIVRNEMEGTGKWEGTPYRSDFIYGKSWHPDRLMIIRPDPDGSFETGRASL